MKTYLGYPTPVKPDHPMYDPFGKYLMRSSGCASFFNKLGLRTLDLRAADAVRTADDAMIAPPVYKQTMPIEDRCARLIGNWHSEQVMEKRMKFLVLVRVAKGGEFD
jgi:hypothetical protein